MRFSSPIFLVLFGIFTTIKCSVQAETSKDIQGKRSSFSLAFSLFLPSIVHHRLRVLGGKISRKIEKQSRGRSSRPARLQMKQRVASKLIERKDNSAKQVQVIQSQYTQVCLRIFQFPQRKTWTPSFSPEPFRLGNNKRLLVSRTEMAAIGQAMTVIYNNSRSGRSLPRRMAFSPRFIVLTVPFTPPAASKGHK